MGRRRERQKSHVLCVGGPLDREVQEVEDGQNILQAPEITPRPIRRLGDESHMDDQSFKVVTYRREFLEVVDRAGSYPGAPDESRSSLDMFILADMTHMDALAKVFAAYARPEVTVIS